MRITCLLLAGTMAMTACRRTETPAPARPAGKPAATASAPAQPAEEPPGAGTDVGAAMPAYSARLLDGGDFDVAKERGNVVLLNIWATWCGPCVFEIPELEAMHRKYGPRGFKVVGVSVDEEGPDVVREFAKKQEITYPLVHDPEGTLAALFEVSVLPTSALVDRKGKIVWKQYGMITEDDKKLAGAIEAALH